MKNLIETHRDRIVYKIQMDSRNSQGNKKSNALMILWMEQQRNHRKNSIDSSNKFWWEKYRMFQSKFSFNNSTKKKNFIPKRYCFVFFNFFCHWTWFDNFFFFFCAWIKAQVVFSIKLMAHKQCRWLLVFVWSNHRFETKHFSLIVFYCLIFSSSCAPVAYTINWSKRRMEEKV